MSVDQLWNVLVSVAMAPPIVENGDECKNTASSDRFAHISLNLLVVVTTSGYLIPTWFLLRGA